MTLVGLSMAFAGSQLTALLFATLTSVVANDLGAGKELIWLFSANIIAIGAAAPFTGPFADMLGRKIVLMFGLGMSMVGTILCASTPNVNGYLAGQAMTGFGVAVQELLAISAVVELVPSSKRGFYVAFVISGFLPFTAGSLYGELIAQVNWRWNNCLVAIWNFLTLLVIGFFYRPPPRANTLGLSKMEILKHIDFLGGFLVVTGLVFLLVGLNWGGQSYPWASTRVISFLAVGVVLLLTFSLWQRVTKWPLFPHRLAQHPRPFFVIMIVIFCAGTSFIPVLLFWSMQVVSVYESNHLEAGIRTLPFGFCVLGGAIISAFVLSAFKKHVRVIMPCFCVIQATGQCPSFDLCFCNCLAPTSILSFSCRLHPDTERR
jgi:MFS family permease